MNKNENGNVELYDWQIKRHVYAMETNIKLLETYGSGDLNLRFIQYFKEDMKTFRDACGMPDDVTGSDLWKTEISSVKTEL